MGVLLYCTFPLQLSFSQTWGYSDPQGATFSAPISLNQLFGPSCGVLWPKFTLWSCSEFPFLWLQQPGKPTMRNLSEHECMGFSLSASYMWDGSKRKFLKGLFCLLATSSSVQVHAGFSKWMLICLNNWQFCGKGQVEPQVQKAKTADCGNKQHKQNWQYCKCMAKSLTLKSHWCNLLILILHRKLWLVPYIIRQQTWTGHQIGHTWQAAISLSFLISAPLRSLCFQSCEWDMLLLHSCFSFHTKTS